MQNFGMHHIKVILTGFKSCSSAAVGYDLIRWKVSELSRPDLASHLPSLVF